MRAPRKIRKPDFSALKEDSETARKFDSAVRSKLLSIEVDMDNPSERLKRLNTAMKEAIDGLPNRKLQPLRKRYVSDQTRELIDSRAGQFQQQSTTERKELDQNIS